MIIENFIQFIYLFLRNLEAETNGVHAQNSQENGGVSSHSNESNLVFPKLLIQLTEEEKEEDFMVFIGSKLPQRPKKRAKLIQRKINVSSSKFFSHFCWKYCKKKHLIFFSKINNS